MMSRAAMEQRRFRALQLLRQGYAICEIVRVLGVTRTSVYRWMRFASVPNQLRARKAPGRPLRLPTEQLRRIVAGREKWSGQALADEILSLTGIRYDRDHCYKLLKRAGR